LKNRKVVVGNPGKVVKDVSDEMIAWKTKGTALYQQLPADCHATLKECEPLRQNASIQTRHNKTNTKLGTILKIKRIKRNKFRSKYNLILSRK
jgi:hypothetical protein